MATSLAVAQRTGTRTRTRTTTTTATATAVAVVQNVLEVGLATVLEARGAFPPDFFVHHALPGGDGGGGEGRGDGGGAGTETAATAARFDEEWLLSTASAASGLSQSRTQTQQSQSQTQTQAASTDGSGSSGDSSSTRGQSLEAGTGAPPPPLSTIVGRDGGGDDGDGQCLSVVSQLQPPSSYYHQRTQTQTQTQTAGGSSTSADDPDDDPDDDHAHRHQRIDQMRSEALLLLEWIRGGVMHEGCWKVQQNQHTNDLPLSVSRVVVGVCVPGNDGGNNGNNDNGQQGSPQARLVESYAFDLSSTAAEVARLSQQGTREGGKSGKKGNVAGRRDNPPQSSEQDVQDAVRQMLKGIRGYVDANYGDGGTGTASSLTQFSTFGELGDATTAAATTRRTLPANRYFTFRVEFARPVPAARLPPALDVASGEFGTVPALGRVLRGEDAVPNNNSSSNTQTQQQHREPTADRQSLLRLGQRWALGRIRPADGMEVGFDAFCEDPDEEANLITCGGGRSENSDPVESSQESSQYIPSVIAIGESVLAYPHVNVIEQALSCAVVDARIHEKHGQQYKVEFDAGHGLEHPKQWMNADRIVVVSGGGDTSRKRKEIGCSSKVEATTDSSTFRPKKKRTRVLYRYIANPIWFKL